MMQLLHDPYAAPKAHDFSSADDLQMGTKLKQKLHYDEIHIPYHFESVLHYKQPLPCGGYGSCQSRREVW
jgi:hypothetical protein